MPRTINLLTVGLDFAWSQSRNPTFNPQMIDYLKRSLGTLDKIPNLHHEVFELDPEAEDCHPHSLHSFTSLFRSRPWDGTVIGGGVRMNPTLTPLFEQLMNMLAREGKGQTKLLFVATGGDHWETVGRTFGEELGMSGMEKGEVGVNPMTGK